ncbi:MAG: hypothetical protein P8M25_10305 [Paracoccaceae bacterium]|jgi:hypothetical protein|nr:hypothetical protein [Paracoccaceae bacterium]
MTDMIWIGSIVSLIGVAAVIWCIATVRNAQKSDLSDSDIRLVLAQVLPKNLAALFISMIGLMIVVTAILLG